MDIPTVNVLSLCTGAGGLDLGLRMALPSSRVVCYVERESAACEILALRMEEGRLDSAPIWTDLRTFDGKPWRGVVDIVAGGFPCQPFSVAGAKLGDQDERFLWPDVERIVRDVRPSFVFLENVPGVADYLDRILGGLASLGFDAEWDLFSAAETGAPHGRERWFCLAHANGQGLEGLPRKALRRASELLALEATPRCLGWDSEPDVGRVAHGLAHCVDRLRALGNGVVPRQAALAFATLSKRLLT